MFFCSPLTETQVSQLILGNTSFYLEVYITKSKSVLDFRVLWLRYLPELVDGDSSEHGDHNHIES